MFVSKLGNRLFSVLDKLIVGIYIETQGRVSILFQKLRPAPLRSVNDIRLSPSDRIPALNKKDIISEKNRTSAKKYFPFLLLVAPPTVGS